MGTQRTLSLLALGAALLAPVHAQVTDEPAATLGMPMLYRWNELRTGFGFDANSSTFGGVISNQLPAVTVTVKSDTKRGDTTVLAGGTVMTPDLTWYYPFDQEGVERDTDGQKVPIGSYLGAIYSSPTVAGVTAGGDTFLTVMFGSESTVDRTTRNPLGYPNVNTADGTYDPSQDPYAWLNNQQTGCVFSLEAYGGTVYDVEASMSTAGRKYQPFWWYGVRNIYYYEPGDASLAGDFLSAPPKAQHELFINASDTMVRAWDYAPSDPITVDPDYGDESAQRKTERLIAMGTYLAPSVEGTDLGSAKLPDGVEAGAGPVIGDRGDVPARLKDRVYNLNLRGRTYGLMTRDSNGPLNNHFRLPAGMGPVRSTGVYVPLLNSITYTSEYYDLDTPKEDRRRVKKLKSDNQTTKQLYVVGSEDGYVYAFDADPTNARKVTTSSGNEALTTYLGRVVWTFRAAARVPLYSKIVSGERVPVTPVATAAGETYPTALENDSSTYSGKYVHVDSAGERVRDTTAALVAPEAQLITGPVTSSPVLVTLPSGRQVILVGSSIGRLFCLNAATGEEIWEFKTTPVGQNVFNVNGKAFQVDSVRAAAITSAPAVGWVRGVSTALDGVAKDRLVVYFGAADGKVYALDVETGSPIGPSSTDGWAVSGTVTTGAKGKYDWRRMDHYGFVTYAFEISGSNVGDTTVNGKPGRAIPATAQEITASVVLRPSEPGPLDANQRRIPYVDRIFVAAPTNLQDADAPGSASGGTIWCLDAKTAEPKWTFDRWRDYTRPANEDFDKSPGDKDQIIRPGGFIVTPALGTNVRVYSDAEEDITSDLARVNVLYAVDRNGKLFAIDIRENITKFEDRLFWRAPYPLDVSHSAGGVYSSPVLSTPSKEPSNVGFGDPGSMDGHSYLYVGVTDGIVAIDTGSEREDQLMDTTGKPLAQPKTGGRLSWKWITATEVMTPAGNVSDNNDGSNDPTYIHHPVRSTPAITSGYLFAGSNNGLLYGWSHADDLFGDNWDFDNGAGTGRGPFRGSNRPRPPLPQEFQPPGGGGAVGDFYVDIFSAGWDLDPSFSATAFASTPIPSGIPPAVTPPPVGVKEATFQTPQGGLLEWGDQIAVMAWGDEINTASTGDLDENQVVFRITGVSTTANLRARLETSGGVGVARQVFYLDPYSRVIPQTLEYPNAPNNVDPDPTKRYRMRNPLASNPLTPGFKGTPYSVSADLRSVTTIVTNGVETKRTVNRQARNTGNQTKFHLANPINLLSYIDGTGVTNLVSPTARGTDPIKDTELDRNGNGRVPVLYAGIGDHGTLSGGASSQSVGSLGPGQIVVQDRSHLPLLAGKAGAAGENIYLRWRVRPARMRWMGGPESCYKPMFHIPDYKNTWPSKTPPEPYLGDWSAQLFTVNQIVAKEVWGAEQPPLGVGEENISPDYPDIMAGTQSWMAQSRYGGTTDAVRTDARAEAGGSPTSAARGGTGVEMQVSVPKYQPANFAPASLSNPYTPGRGPGYYTINPRNSSAVAAAAFGWRPNPAPSIAGPYRADIKDAALFNYLGNAGAVMPVSPSLLAQEQNYLTLIYADTNGNGQADNSAGEAYRMIVAGVQVRPTESLRVETSTIDVPRSPESYIPAGYVPFQYYWPSQVAVAGAAAGSEDPYLFGERSFYTPFAVYNNGNTNLWSVRLDKFDPMAGHLTAPDVDQNLFAGASPLSNWPGSGVLKRFNLASTLDALPIAPGKKGGPDDPLLFTPARKPRPSAADDGRGQLMSVKDVFPFNDGAPFSNRNVRQGLPYVTVAVPPGTPPGRYSTPSGRLVLFEDSGGIYKADPRIEDYNGYLDTVNGQPLESGITSDATVNVTVGEARLTDKVSRLTPLMPNVDSGVAFARSNPPIPPGNANELAAVWQALAQDATPTGFRDPRTGRFAVVWSSNRVKIGGSNIPGVPSSNAVSQVYRIFGSSMNWQDPADPPIDPGADVTQFRTGTLSKDPWGWQYQGGNVGSFWFPNFNTARWFGPSRIDPFVPDDDVLNAALGQVPGAKVDAALVSFTSPSAITDFHGTDFPAQVFFVGTVGTGTQQRSAIFQVPVEANDDGSLTGLAKPQPIGVGPTRATLDPAIPKYQPRPFLITADGSFDNNGILSGEEVFGLGVVWFGGAPGRWELFVSTIGVDDLDKNGMAKDPTLWKTTRLQVPEGVQSALHPSVNYRQQQLLGTGSAQRIAVLDVAFSGYSRSGRNPDIYVARYQALTTNASGQTTIGNWQQLGFARRGASAGSNDSPLEPLLRDPGDARPVYRSHWTSWYGRRNTRPVVYWFKFSGDNNERRELYATFQPRLAGNVGRNQGYVIEADALQPDGRPFPANHPMRKVSAYFDLAAGSIRFTTSDPVNAPAPLSRRYTDKDGVQKQDFIYASFNPYAMRVTMDSDFADTMPQIWMDDSPEVITQPGRTVFAPSVDKPAIVKRDRMWVVWRRSTAPQGAVRSSMLFYQTFRLAIDIGTAIPVDAAGNVRMKLRDSRGRDLDIPFTVSPSTGRMFFTTELDGAVVEVEVDGKNLGRFTVGWVTENPPAPVRYWDTADGFRLPVGQWASPKTVPIQGTGNDSQPFLFKDPFSYQLPPGTDGASAAQTRYYYSRGNNNMWLLWSSTRPSRTMGHIVNSPVTPGVGPQPEVDPFYYSTSLLPAPDGKPMNALTYSASASDVYFTALSPDFGDK